MREEIEVLAYIIDCDIGKVRFGISIKGIKNNENPCSHCPLKNKCPKYGKVEHLHFYEDLRVHNLQTPIHKVVG